MASQRGHVAVVTADRIHTDIGERFNFNPASYSRVTLLAARALAHDIEQVWVMPGAGLPRPGEGGFTAPRDGWRIFVPHGTPPTSAEVRRDGPERGTGRVLINWLDTGRGWHAWAGITDPYELLATVKQYRDALGVAPTFSPGGVGIQLLRDYMDREQWMAPATLPKSHGRTVIPYVQGYGFVRAFDDAPYLHAYDTNAAWLAVAETQRFGVGDPVELAQAPDTLPVGYWQVDAEYSGELWDGIHAPSPFSFQPGRPVRNEYHGWAWTQTVQIALRLGWRVKLGKGYVWPERHQLMRRWAEHVWHGISSTSGPTRAAIKDTWRAGLGRLGHKDSEGSWYYRPDWYSMVHAESNRKQLAMIANIHDACGLLPVAVNVDALVYATEHADPASVQYSLASTTKRQAWRGPLLIGQGKLGGYKHEGTVSGIEAAGLAMGARAGMGVADFMAQFHGAAERTPAGVR